MTNITKEVQRFIDQDSSIKRDLSRDLINHRALALFIKKSLKLSCSVDAVISAIRRYGVESIQDKRFDKAFGLIKKAKISTKNHICNIALVKDSQVQSYLPKLFSIINYDRGEVLRIIQAEESIKVIVDQKNTDSVLLLFPKSKIKSVEKNLAEINLSLGDISAKIPGVLSVINSELASNDINIVETTSCVPEVIYFISEKDLLKAHNVLLQMMQN